MQQAHLIEKIAEISNLSRRECTELVRAFFETIETALAKDNYVKIRNFGTFKVVQVAPRESVNIHTGERFQLEGRSKVSFQPDPFLRDLVNAPFLHFQSITLPDDIDATLMDAVAEGLNAELEPIEPEPETMEPESEPTEEEPDADATSGRSVGANHHLPQPSTEPSTPEPEPLEPEPEPEEPEPEPQEPDPEPSEEELSDEEDEPDAESDDEEDDDEDWEGVCEEDDEKKSRLKGCLWKAIAAILALTVLLVAYFAGYFRLLCPCLWDSADEVPVKVEKIEPAPVSTDTVAAPARTDSIPSDTLAPQNAAPAEKPAPATAPAETSKPKSETATPKAETAKPRTVTRSARGIIVGKRQDYIVQRGQTLYSIAREVYGDTRVVPFIQQYNNLASGDHIEVGTVLSLPEVQFE